MRVVGAVEPKGSMAFGEVRKILLGMVLPRYQQVSVPPMKYSVFDPIQVFDSEEVPKL